MLSGENGRDLTHSVGRVALCMKKRMFQWSAMNFLSLNSWTHARIECKASARQSHISRYYKNRPSYMFMRALFRFGAVAQCPRSVRIFPNEQKQTRNAWVSTNYIWNACDDDARASNELGHKLRLMQHFPLSRLATRPENNLKIIWSPF